MRKLRFFMLACLLLPGVSFACPNTDLVENYSCVPEADGEFNIYAPGIFGEFEKDYYAVFDWESEGVWRVSAFGPKDAIQKETTIYHVERGGALWCRGKNVLHFSEILLPDGETVSLTLRQSRDNWLIWVSDPTAECIL